MLGVDYFKRSSSPTWYQKSIIYSHNIGLLLPSSNEKYPPILWVLPDHEHFTTTRSKWQPISIECQENTFRVEINRYKEWDLFFKKIIFNWRMITILWWFLPYINTSQSYSYTYAPSLLTSLLSPSPSHPSRLSQSTSFGFPVSYRKFPLAMYFTHGNRYISMLLSQIIPPSPAPTVSKSLFSMSASPFLPCR